MAKANPARMLRRILTETKTSDRPPAAAPTMALRVPQDTVATMAANAKQPDATLHASDRCELVVSNIRITQANIGQPENMSGLVNASW